MNDTNQEQNPTGKESLPVADEEALKKLIEQGSELLERIIHSYVKEKILVFPDEVRIAIAVNALTMVTLHILSNVRLESMRDTLLYYRAVLDELIEDTKND